MGASTGCKPGAADATVADCISWKESRDAPAPGATSPCRSVGSFDLILEVWHIYNLNEHAKSSPAQKEPFCIWKILDLVFQAELQRGDDSEDHERKDTS